MTLPFPHALSRFILLFTGAVAVACGVEPGVDPALDENADPIDGCAFDEDLFFDPHGTQVQWRGDGACALLIRSSPGEQRRGVEWTADRLVVVTTDRSYDLEGPELSYENSHHNCKDRVAAEAAEVALVVDGIEEDVCFSTEIGFWRGVLDVVGRRYVLEPVNVPQLLGGG